MNEGVLRELPGGWVWTRLGELIEPSNKKANPLEIEKMPYIGLEHIEKDTGKLLSYGDSKEVRSTKTRFHNGDLLYGKLRPYLNKVLVVDFDGICSTDILVFPKNSYISNEYVAHRFLCSDFVRYANRNVSGVQHPRVNFTTLSQFSIPLPPLPEQRAIVSKIEQLFSDLDSGINNFKKAQAQLKLYRQSVLKAACEGKLVPTEAELARAQGREYEAADVLLARVLRERREKSNGVKYKESAEPNINGLTELPEGWTWASIGQVTECLDHMRIPINKNERAKRVGAIPYYGANGQVDWIDDYIFDEPLVLIVEDETFVGREKPFCYKITGKSWVNNHAHVLRANNAVNVDFLNYSLMYYPFTPLTTGTTGRKKLIKSVLMQAPYSLPPLAEQRRIVSEVERRLSISDKMEATITESLQKAEYLRQSILKKAFEGKLLNKKELEEVRNAPDWEPAERLLERIRREKQINGKNNKLKVRKTHG